jgi:hypothetical protein
MEPQVIPGWSFLTAQFLIHFERNKKERFYSEVNQSFLAITETEPRLKEFPYINPGAVIMVCYGLLVYPIEFWKNAPDELYDHIEIAIMNIAQEMRIPDKKRIQDLFTETKDNFNDLSVRSIFRSLRNAISHSHVDFNPNKKQYIFWNINKENAKDFDVSITENDLSILLTGVGRFFSNIENWEH